MLLGNFSFYKPFLAQLGWRLSQTNQVIQSSFRQVNKEMPYIPQKPPKEKIPIGPGVQAVG